MAALKAMTITVFLWTHLYFLWWIFNFTSHMSRFQKLWYNHLFISFSILLSSFKWTLKFEKTDFLVFLQNVCNYTSLLYLYKAIKMKLTRISNFVISWKESLNCMIGLKLASLTRRNEMESKKERDTEK